MNGDVTIAAWHEFKVLLRRSWNDLTDEDLETIARDSSKLVQVVQKRYGVPGHETGSQQCQSAVKAVSFNDWVPETFFPRVNDVISS